MHKLYVGSRSCLGNWGWLAVARSLRMEVQHGNLAHGLGDLPYLFPETVTAGGSMATITQGNFIPGRLARPSIERHNNNLALLSPDYR